MTFNVWTFLFEVLNFLVLAFVLHRLLYRPVREAVERRSADNDRARTEAAAARKDADALRQQLAATLAETDRERQEVLRRAAEQAGAEKAKRIAEAEASAKAVGERARREAEQLRHDAITSLEGDVGRLAVGLAERILAQACDASLDRQFARHLVETLAGVTGEDRERVRRDAATGDAVIESAAELGEPTRRELTVAVHELLGRECGVTFAVHPALVGGMLARVGGHVWDATVAAQIEAAKAAAGGGHGPTG